MAAAGATHHRNVSSSLFTEEDENEEMSESSHARNDDQNMTQLDDDLSLSGSNSQQRVDNMLLGHLDDAETHVQLDSLELRTTGLSAKVSHDTEISDDGSEMNEMRATLLGMVHQEAEQRHMVVPLTHKLEYSNNAKENELLALHDQKSIRDVIHMVQERSLSPKESSRARSPSSHDSEPPQQNSNDQNVPLFVKAMSTLSTASSPLPPPQPLPPAQQRPFMHTHSSAHGAEHAHIQQSMVNANPPASYANMTNNVYPQPQLSSAQSQPMHGHEQQQRLLQQLRSLEKDDPDPNSAKIWSLMQRLLITEDVPQRQQQNMDELAETLQQKHTNVVQMQSSDSGSKLQNTEQQLMRSIHQMTKETKDQLQEMKQQLNEERRKNEELRSKMRQKNRQIKDLTVSIDNNNMQSDDGHGTAEESYTFNYTIPPVTFDPDQMQGSQQRRLLSMDDMGSISSTEEETPSTFSRWCMNMGLTPAQTKCSWF